MVIYVKAAVVLDIYCILWYNKYETAAILS